MLAFRKSSMSESHQCQKVINSVKNSSMLALRKSSTSARPEKLVEKASERRETGSEVACKYLNKNLTEQYCPKQTLTCQTVSSMVAAFSSFNWRQPRWEPSMTRAAVPMVVLRNRLGGSSTWRRSASGVYILRYFNIFLLIKNSHF